MTSTPPPQISLAAARVLERIRAVADSRSVVEVFGSSVYAPTHAEDVDVLVSDDDPQRLSSALGLTSIPTVPPRLTGTLGGTKVDVTVVTGEGELSSRMRSGPRDAVLLSARLHEHGRDEAFQVTWPELRRFVRARALGHNGLGWFGSFGWALLLAVPLVQDPEVGAAAPGHVLPAWLRWLARLAPGTRVSFDAIRRGDPEPLYLVAPAPPTRDVARLTKQAAAIFFGEARAAALAIGEARGDGEALERIRDLAADPPSGTTLAIGGDDEHTRGRYDGVARGLLRELETLGAIRSWGRFEVSEDGSWQHRITVPTRRAEAARTLVESWLALNRMDASLV